MSVEQLVELPKAKYCFFSSAACEFIAWSSCPPISEESDSMNDSVGGASQINSSWLTSIISMWNYGAVPLLKS